MLILQFVSWRMAFAIFGVIGMVWAFFFYRWFRDDPRDNPKVNAAELKLLEENRRLAHGHPKVPWHLAGRRPVVLLALQYACLSYGWYFYITWLPTYLRQGRSLTPFMSALLGILPLFLGGCGSFFSGLIAEPVTRWTGSVAKGRRLMAYLAFTGAGTLLLISTKLHDPLLAMIAMGFASFCNDLVMPGAWGACMDVGGKYAGTLSGTMNMMGNFGGALSPTITGYILSATHNDWNLAFYVSAAVYYLGTFCWVFIDPVTPLEKDE
jgi:predicted MFS family arabinose efflux permease